MGGGTVDQISKMLDAHYSGKINISDYWALGDLRKVTIGAHSTIVNGNRITTTIDNHYISAPIIEQPSQIIELMIIGFNHDNLSTPIGGTTKAAITVQTKDCLSVVGAMNYSDDAEYSLWAYSGMKLYLDQPFKNALPSNVTSLIKSVTKTYNGTTYGNGGTTTNDVFLLGQLEICGKYASNTTNSNANTNGAEGTQYAYYNSSLTSDPNKVKRLGCGSSTTQSWWTRTGYVSNSHARYGVVSTTGSISDTVYSATATGISPVFCL